MDSSLWLLILAVLAAGRGGSASPDTVTSELACSALSRYKADCGNGSQALVAPLALWYGAKPLESGCQGNSCCQQDLGRDCTFQDNLHMDDVIEGCSGKLACFISPVNLRPAQCAYPGLFPNRTDYSYLAYKCINVGQLRDVCDQGAVDTGATHHVVSNVFFNNRNLTSRSCSCQASTRCGAQVVFKAVDVRLSKGDTDTCMETFNMADSFDPGKNKTITCQDRQLYGWMEIFRSDSNRARMSLDIGSSHQGTLWVVIESSDPTAEVELACGRVETVEPLEENRCPTTTATSATTPHTPTTPKTATTASTPGISVATSRSGDSQGTATPSSGDATSNTGVIAGAVIGSILIVALLVAILIIAVFILRSRSSQPGNLHDHGGAPTEPEYDNLPFTPGHFEPIYHNNVPQLYTTMPTNGVMNPMYGAKLKTPFPDTPPPSHPSPPLPLTPAPRYHVGEPYIQGGGAGEDAEEFQEVDEESSTPSNDNRANESQESCVPLARE